MNPGYDTPSVTARACCCSCQGCRVTCFLCLDRDERAELPDFSGERKTALKNCKDLVPSDLTTGEKHWNRVDCKRALYCARPVSHWYASVRQAATLALKSGRACALRSRY